MKLGGTQSEYAVCWSLAIAMRDMYIGQDPACEAARQ